MSTSTPSRGVRDARIARMERATHDRHSGLTVAVLVAVAAGLVLGRFGLPPIDLHGPTHRLGLMDPACGMTRAAAALGRADLTGAWRFNPGVFLLAAFAVGMIVRALIGWTTGIWWWLQLRGWAVWVALALGLAVLEVNQQLHATLLR